MTDADELRAYRIKELAELMSGISEGHYCAGWLIDLEYILWAMLQGGNREFGFSPVEQDDIDRMRELSGLVGGWIWWKDGEHPFIPLAEWETKYAMYRENHS